MTLSFGASYQNVHESQIFVHLLQSILLWLRLYYSPSLLLKVYRFFLIIFICYINPKVFKSKPFGFNKAVINNHKMANLGGKNKIGENFKV